jgi:peptidoglycan/LPS O-acetylase OafA/YrhL
MKYFKQLDGLRFIAVSFVLIEHFAHGLGRHFTAGYYGVDLFFVLSGFLITNILIKSREPFGKAYKNFIGRRTLRIFPVYYLTIAVLFIIGNPNIHQWLVYCLTYTYNYATGYFNINLNSINHFWSLSVEEQFYLFWPFIILGLRNKSTLLKSVICLQILIGGSQLYLYVFKIKDLNVWGLIPQSYALGIGGLGAILRKENKVPLRLLDNKVYEYVVITSLIFLLISNLQIKYLICPLLSLFFVLKITHNGFSNRALNNFLNHHLVVYMGIISYGIYLFHLPLGDYLNKYIFSSVWQNINWNLLGKLEKIQSYTWIVTLPLYSFFSIVLAHLSYKYFEKPLLSLKNKWFKV